MRRLDWGNDSGDPEYVAAAKRIVKVLRERDGPIWEKELRKLASVTSIGAYFRYLASTYGVIKIEDWVNRPDDDNKLYVLGHRVRTFDQQGNEVVFSTLRRVGPLTPVTE